MFDVVKDSERFSESLARYFFKQLIEGLQHCHTNGLVHRDIKLENLLLGDQFNLKIADFGYAQSIMGKDGKGFNSTDLGTPGYKAPEIAMKVPYKGEKSDIFSAGVCLFIMISKRLPFTEAKQSDKLYRCVAVKRQDIFWRYHKKTSFQGQEFFSDEAKDLINKMLALQPD